MGGFEKESGSIPGQVVPDGGVRSRPILFSAPMVRALLAGTKTQTRRIVKPQPHHGPVGKMAHLGGGEWAMDDGDLSGLWSCPYGQAGETPWVREAFARTVNIEHQDPWPDRPHAWCDEGETEALIFAADGPWTWLDGDGFETGRTHWKPSIHMPRWASRITLRITDVRVERLIEISEADALAEGIVEKPDRIWWVDDGDPNHGYGSPRAAYAELWTAINGEGSWAANPWVWAVSFEVINPAVGASPSGATVTGPGTNQ